MSIKKNQIEKNSPKSNSRRGISFGKRFSKSFVDVQTNTENNSKTSVGVETRNKFHGTASPRNRKNLDNSKKFPSKSLKFINNSTNSSDSENSVVKAIRLVSKIKPAEVGRRVPDEDISQPELSEPSNRSDDEKNSTSTFDHSLNDEDDIFPQHRSKHDDDHQIMDRSISNSTFDYEHMNIPEPENSNLNPHHRRNGNSQKDQLNLDEGSNLNSGYLPSEEEQKLSPETNPQRGELKKYPQKNNWEEEQNREFQPSKFQKIDQKSSSELCKFFFI